MTAKSAFVYGLLTTSLIFALWHINALGFVLIDTWFPGTSGETVDDYAMDYARRQMRWSIAMLVVALPSYLWLNRRLAATLRADPASRKAGLRKWFGYLTLFIAALTMAGDLIWAIYALLMGDLTAQFAAKAGLVLVSAGLVFAHYRLEAEDADAA